MQREQAAEAMTRASGASPGEAIRATILIAALHADLGSEVGDHCRCHVRLLVGKPAVLAPECKLDREAQLASVNPPGEQRQILWQQRPVLSQLVRRPQPLHPLPPLSAPKRATLRIGTGTRHLRWPNRIASRSLGLVVPGLSPAAWAALRVVVEASGKVERGLKPGSAWDSLAVRTGPEVAEARGREVAIGLAAVVEAAKERLGNDVVRTMLRAACDPQLVMN